MRQPCELCEFVRDYLKSVWWPIGAFRVYCLGTQIVMSQFSMHPSAVCACCARLGLFSLSFGSMGSAQSLIESVVYARSGASLGIFSRSILDVAARA